jgi:hypothetical protein
MTLLFYPRTAMHIDAKQFAGDYGRFRGRVKINGETVFMSSTYATHEEAEIVARRFMEAHSQEQ